MSFPSRSCRCAGIVVVMVLLQLPAVAARRSVGYSLHRVRNIPVHVISVDLQDPYLLVTPALAYGTLGRRQSFKGFLSDYQPLAQMTGSYFGLRNSYPIGDIVVKQHHQYRGSIGSALAVKPDNTAWILDVPYLEDGSWGGYESVMRGGIRLLEGGQRCLFPRDQGFRDPAVYRNATRTAVGLKNHRKLLMVAITRTISLSDLVHIMKTLGCRDAMALDGGSSTGLACGRSTIVSPARSLVSVLMVTQREHPVKPQKARRSTSVSNIKWPEPNQNRSSIIWPAARDRS